MKINGFRVMEDCIERGVISGWYRAHKHDTNPAPERIQDTISEDVLNAICEYFYLENFSAEEIQAQQKE